MARKYPGNLAGLGFAAVVAAVTLAVAIVAAVFLIRDSGDTLPSAIPLPWQPPPVVVAHNTSPHPDHARAKPQRIARNLRSVHRIHA